MTDNDQRTQNGVATVSGSDDNTARIWDGQTGAEIAVLKGHSSWVWTVAWSPDGRRLATGSGDNTAPHLGRADWHAADRPGLGRLRRARAWLLASALVAPGAADGIAARSRPPPTQSINHASAPSSKAPQAEHHKGNSATATKHKEAARPSDRRRRRRTRRCAQELERPAPSRQPRRTGRNEA